MASDQRELILVKVETTVGTDAVPVVATNAVKTGKIDIKTVTNTDTRNNIMAYFGAQSTLVGSAYHELNFEVEATTSGTAGTVDQVSPLLRACAMSETLNGVIDVTYAMASSSLSTVTIYDYADGIFYKTLAAMASVSLMFEIDKIPRWKFKITGLRAPATDAAIPTGAVYANKIPLMVTNANTTFSIMGVTSPAILCKSIEFDLGSDIKFIPWMGGEKVSYVNRNPKGKFEIWRPALSVFNPFALAGIGGGAITKGQIWTQYGQTAGNILKVSTAATGAVLSNPVEGSFNGERTWQVDFAMEPVTGNDEFTAVFK